MILDKKVIKYKVIDFIEKYNFGIDYVNTQGDLKILNI
jgi:hypothetical protein